MEARDEKTLESLNESARFVIHTYQRSISWIERKCRQYSNDIMRTGWNDLISVYFVGSTVFDESARHQLLLVATKKSIRTTRPDMGFVGKQIVKRG